MWYVHIGTGEADTDTYHDSAIATRWRKQVPFVSLGLIIRNASSENTAQQSECVLMVEEQYAEALNIETSDAVRRTGERVCLCTCIQYPEGMPIVESVEPIVSEARRRNLRLQGSIESQLLASFIREDRECAARLYGLRLNCKPVTVIGVNDEGAHVQPDRKAVKAAR